MGKQANKKFGPFWPSGPRWENLFKILSLFNAQTNRPRAFHASFQHVGQAPYSIDFKYEENKPIKNLFYFGLQGRCETA